MKNHKTSYSLTKLHSKKASFHDNSQRSLSKQKKRNANKSHIQNPDSKNHNFNDQQQAVYKEYYGTAMNLKNPIEDNLKRYESKKRKGFDNFISQIEQKMKKVIQSDAYESDINLQNIVIEQSDGDQDFEDKILQNKQLLKIHRKRNVNTISQQKLHQQFQGQKQRKLSKKLSLIQNKVQKPLRKLKSKSLFPPINSFSSKILQIHDYKNIKMPKNQTQKQIVNQQILIQQEKNNKIDVKSNNQKTNLNKKSDNQKFKRKFTQVKKKKQERKLTELKLQSKIQELKTKIGQRTSAHQTKGRMTDQHGELINKIKTPRYSSHSVFDNIQEFLSNPHDNNTKSQRRFLKLYQKIEENEHTRQKEKIQIKEKIKMIQQQIKTFEGSADIQILQEQRIKDRIFQKQDVRGPTISTDSSPFQENGSEHSGVVWRRMQNKNLNKSDFEKELKYVISLQQKGGQILRNYVQNHKILHEIKMIKRTQQMLNKNSEKYPQQLKKQNYSSL